MRINDRSRYARQASEAKPKRSETLTQAPASHSGPPAIAKSPSNPQLRTQPNPSPSHTHEHAISRPGMSISRHLSPGWYAGPVGRALRGRCSPRGHSHRGTGLRRGIHGGGVWVSGRGGHACERMLGREMGDGCPRGRTHRIPISWCGRGGLRVQGFRDASAIWLVGRQHSVGVCTGRWVYSTLPT